jgi:hypothetical protein
MLVARILLFAVALAIGPVVPSIAYSWYPGECCSNHDRMPADDLQEDRDGN